MFHATSQTFNVATHLTSDHHILHLRSHYTAVCFGTTISHHHISKPMFHITQPQSTSHTHHYSTPHSHSTSQHISHHTIFHIALYHHILILHHNTTSDITTLHHFPHLTSHSTLHMPHSSSPQFRTTIFHITS